jgi:NAD(P)-dependent dehydrogenase (short-subunit alcohol dehydrogenase family)
MPWNPMDLTGKRIAVTGASSGIGQSIAQTLSRLGAQLVLIGRDTQRLTGTMEQLEGDGHQIHAMDLTDLDGIPAFLKTVAGDGRRLSGLVHSAGVLTMTPMQVLKGRTIGSIFEVNVSAALMLARGLTQRSVLHPDGGGLVFISSVMGLVGQPGLVTYSASKGAILSMTRSLALELASSKVRVNAVAPGYVTGTQMSDNLKDTLTSGQFDDIEKMHPLGLGQATDVALAVAYLLSDASRWVTGSTLVVDGGYCCH